MGHDLSATEASAAIYDLTACRLIKPAPGQTAAQNALADHKTPEWIKIIAAQMVGDHEPPVHPGHITDYPVLPIPPQQYLCTPVRPSTAELFSAASTAAVIFAAGWVAGLLTVIATLH